MASKRGIRSYGPGKFSTIIDSYASAASLDGGADEEMHLDDSYYGMVRVDPSFRKAVRAIAADEGDKLNNEEKALLEESEAVIFFERSDGIVEVDWYDNADDAEKAWSEIESGFDDEDDEVDEEAEEEE